MEEGERLKVGHPSVQTHLSISRTFDFQSELRDRSGGRDDQAEILRRKRSNKNSEEESMEGEMRDDLYCKRETWSIFQLEKNVLNSFRNVTADLYSIRRAKMCSLKRQDILSLCLFTQRETESEFLVSSAHCNTQTGTKRTAWFSEWMLIFS